MGTGSYVTGISNELEGTNSFHIVLFDPSVMKLYYSKIIFTAGSVWASELYHTIDYIRETVFVGSAM